MRADKIFSQNTWRENWAKYSHLLEHCQYTYTQCFTNTCVCVVQVNLMQYMKLSTSRDFRINAATLDAALQEQDDSLEVSAMWSCNWQLQRSTAVPLGFCWVRFQCLFLPPFISDHRDTGGRGDARTQTEEAKTVSWHARALLFDTYRSPNSSLTFTCRWTSSGQSCACAAVLNNSCLVLSLFHQRTFGDVDDLVDVQGFTYGKFVYIV